MDELVIIEFQDGEGPVVDTLCSDVVLTITLLPQYLQHTVSLYIVSIETSTWLVYKIKCAHTHREGFIGQTNGYRLPNTYCTCKPTSSRVLLIRVTKIQ